MNQKVKEICIRLYNLKNGPFWKKGNVVVVRKGNDIVFDHVKIRSYGKGNSVTIGNGTRLHNILIQIRGNNNHIEIGENCSLNDTYFVMEDDGNMILMGEGSTTTGEAIMSAIEGTRLIVGKDAMFSKDIYIATGDGHGIVDETENRMNVSRDIIIGNHVWIGFRCIINKGAIIPDHVVCGNGSVVGKSLNSEMEKNCIIAGNPAIVVKKSCDWRRDRMEGK